MTIPMLPGPRRLRVRVFDGNYEVLRDRRLYLVADPDHPDSLIGIETNLRLMWRAAAYQLRLTGGRELGLRLQVHEWGEHGNGGEKLLDWVAR
jgi:hypothetical protein